MRYALLFVFLGGCALHEQMIADQILSKGPTCEKLGYSPDTDAFRACQIQLYQADQGRANAAAGFMMNRPLPK